MGILDYGAGAAGGLESVLERLMKEEELRQRSRALDETTRSNQAREGLTLRGIEETGLLRRQQDQNMMEYRRGMDKDRDLSRVRSSLNMQPIGAPVQPQTRALQEEAGASPANYLDIFLPGRSTPEGDDPTAQGMSLWRGTPEQVRLENAGAGGSVNLQRDTVTIRDPQAAAKFGVRAGEPIDIDINPRTGQKSYRGQDVTQIAEHWDKPTPPAFSFIQSGDEYVAGNRRTGGVQPITAPGGGSVPLATTSGTRTMQEGAKMIIPSIHDVAEDAGMMNKVGLFGPFMGRVATIATKLGTVQGLASEDLDTQQRAMLDFGQAVSSDPSLATDRLAGRFATALGLLSSGAGRVHGGARGGGSIQMIDYMKNIIGGNSSTLDLFLGRLDGLERVMKHYAEGPGGGGGTPQPEAPLDIYQQYLNRPRRP